MPAPDSIDGIKSEARFLDEFGLQGIDKLMCSVHNIHEL